MREFFRGWKRKVGVATLVAACAFMYLWMISDSNVGPVGHVIRLTDQKAYRLVARRSNIIWDKIECDLPLFVDSRLIGAWVDSKSRTVNFPEVEDKKFSWSLNIVGIRSGSASVGDHRYKLDINTIRVPLWLIVIPLTLLSTWLFLNKPPNRSLKVERNEPGPT
jgi:hypothetical protein